MPDATPSTEAEDADLPKCLHCRKRPATQRMAGANLCAGCVEKGVQSRYDIERDPEHVVDRARFRAVAADAERSQQAANRRAQDKERGIAAALIALKKAPPEPVKSGSQLRAEARERAQPAEVG